MTAPAELPDLSGGDGRTGAFGIGRPRLGSLIPTSPAGSSRLGYVASLDGLRGLAVMAVLLYHADVSWMQGGFLGVDAFFVLSGYLITTLVIREQSDTGGVDLRGFWARRAVRLLPALFALLAVLVTWAAFFPSGRELGRDIVGALGYVTNWQLITSGESYFDQFGAPSPLQHAWSLAIEEQFYLFWPLAAVALLGRGRSLSRLGVAAGVGAVLSAVWMAVLFDPATDPSRLYYGTDTRAQSLLIGALAAVVAVRWPLSAMRPVRAGLRVGALVAAPLLLVAWFIVDDTGPGLYRGGFFLAAVAVAVVVLAASQPGPNPLRDALSWPPLVAIGVLSYGLYLWHWPLYLVINSDSTGLEGGPLVAMRLAAAAAAAVASYHLVEMPVRERAAEGRLPALRLAGVMPITLVVVLVAALSSNALIDRPRPTGFTDDDLVAMSQAPPPTLPAGGRGAGPAAPVAPAEVEPAEPPLRALMVGDSVAATLGFGFGSVNLDPGLLGSFVDPNLDLSTLTEDIVLWNRGILGCRLFAEPSRDANRGVEPETNGCPDPVADWGSAVTEFDPEVAVVSVGAWEVFDRRFGDRWVSWGEPEFDRRFERRMTEVLDSLTGNGARAVLLTAPLPNRDPSKPDQAASQTDPDRFRHLNGLLRDVARGRADTTIVDMAGEMCAEGECGKSDYLRYDGLHFSAAGALQVARWITPQLTELVRGERT
jgi:peptidoglycan/LPS O-acetylase OafA/YrhL